jgi:hypothetical protein
MLSKIAFSAILLVSVGSLGSTALAETPDRYIGLGLELNDGELGAISKVQISDLKKDSGILKGVSLSIRPSITFDNGNNATLPVTIDKNLGQNLEIYGGLGADLETSGDNDFGLIGVVGADYSISKKIVANGNFKFGNSEEVTLGLGFKI